MEQEYYYYGSQTLTPETINQLLNMTKGIISVDIETISIDNKEPLGIGFAYTEDDAFYFPIDSPLLPWHLLENTNIAKLMHNGAFDLGVLKLFFDMDLSPVLDSMIEAQLQGLPLSLDNLSQYFFNISLITIESLIGKKGVNQLTMDQVPEAVTAEKCGQDVIYTMKVWNKLAPEVNWPILNLEMELQPILVRMENYGLRVDQEKLAEHHVELEKEVSYYREVARGYGFNPGSSKQFAAILESRGHTVKYDKTTWNPKLGEKELKEYLDDPLTHLVLNYRKKKILKSTFVEALYKKHLVGGRVFPRVNQGIAASGRLTRTRPNTQNIPPEMRDIFIPTEGFIYEAWDLSQIELRILAYFIAVETGDMTMMDVYLNNGDIHDATVQRMIALGFLRNLIPYEQRRIGKIINFAAAYRGTEHTLYANAGIPFDQGKAFLAAYFSIYPGLNTLFFKVCQELRRDGYVSTLLGRRRYFPELEGALSGGKKLEWMVEKFYREAFNHKIQGTAGEDMKQLQVRNKDERQVNTIHDEIIFDIHPDHILNRDTIKGLTAYRTPMGVARAYDWKALSYDDNKVGTWG